MPVVFRGLSQADAAEAEGFFQQVDVTDGDVIMVEGEEDQTLAFIISGSVEVWMGNTKVGTAGQGDILGEMELFYPMPRACSVTAAYPVSLHILTPENFQALCATGNPIVYQIERASIRRLGDQLRRLNTEIASRSEGQVLMIDPKEPGLLRRLFSGRNRTSEVHPAEVLTRSDMFNWAPEPTVHAIAPFFDVQRYDAETVICEQGEDGDRMYVIAQGEVEVVLYTDEEGDSAETVGRLKPGHAFGDASIVMLSERSASCIARSEVYLLEMDRTTFLQLHGQDDHIGSIFRQGMIRNLAIQLIATTRRYLALQSVLRQESSHDSRDIWR